MRIFLFGIYLFTNAAVFFNIVQNAFDPFLLNRKIAWKCQGEVVASERTGGDSLKRQVKRQKMYKQRN